MQELWLADFKCYSPIVTLYLCTYVNVAACNADNKKKKSINWKSLEEPS